MLQREAEQCGNFIKNGMESGFIDVVDQLPNRPTIGFHWASLFALGYSDKRSALNERTTGL
jgi:hypothetical protein